MNDQLLQLLHNLGRFAVSPIGPGNSEKDLVYELRLADNNRIEATAIVRVTSRGENETRPDSAS